MRVVVVDDHPVVREGLAKVLADAPTIDVVGQAGTAEEALEVVAATRADVVVVDLRLPEMSGAELCSELRRRDRTVLTLVISSNPTADSLLSVLEAGARGFVLKESDPTLLVQALRALDAGHYFLDPRVASTVVQLAITGPRRTDHRYGLTTQEMRVLSFLPSGLSNREIAIELGITVNTVKSHLRSALRKVEARDRAQAAAIVLREGLV
jgi:two-component system response regulator DevR